MMCDDDLGLDKKKLCEVMKISPKEAESVIFLFLYQIKNCLYIFMIKSYLSFSIWMEVGKWIHTSF